MYKYFSFFALLFLLLFTSCSESEEEIAAVSFLESEEEIAAVSFLELETSKTSVFRDEFITLTIDGLNYSDVNVDSSIPSEKLNIEKIAKNVVEISSSEAVSGRVYVTLVNEKGDLSNVRNISVEFFEHGVVDGKTVEGIRIDKDRREKVISLLGEPEDTFLDSDRGVEYLYYLSLGVAFQLSNNIVSSATLYSSDFSKTIDGVRTRYVVYPYDLPNGWKIRQTTMDTVIETLGAPDAKSSSLDTNERVLRSYRFDSLRSWIRFYSEDENEYSGETIRSVSIF